jgi:adenylate cyclase
MDWDAEGLLDGLEPTAREARRALLDQLHEQGVAPEDLRRAVQEDRLVLLPIELALLSAPKYTLEEISRESGVPEDHVAAFWRALGLTLSDDARFTDEDLEAAKRTRLYLDAGMPREEILGLLRVMSSSIQRSAEAIRATFARRFLQPGDSEADLAARFADMGGALMPLVVADLEYLMRVHLREFSRHDALGVAELDSGQLPDTQEVAVAFADLVGFTELGESLPEVELGEIADRLTDLTLERIRTPVRLVKTIGDAVMLVSPQPAPLVALLLELVDAAAADERMPPLRAGASWGLAYPRLGDWYGGTVNLASRVAGRARPGSVLVTTPLRDALDGGFEFSRAGLKRLKNVAEPVEAWRVRKAGS